MAGIVAEELRITVNRDWRLFWRYAFKSTKYMVIGCSLIPVYSFFLNPEVKDFFPRVGQQLTTGFEICAVYWVLMTAYYALIYIYPGPESLLKHKTSIPRQVGAGLSIMAISVGVVNWLDAWMHGSIFEWSSVSSSLLVGGITYLMSMYVVAYRRTREHNLELQAKSAESQLHVLKTQMQPHFLFNSLNSLAELIDTNKPSAAVMTQKLADLYRQILLASAGPENSVRGELEIVESYLQLEQLRFGERLKYSVSQSGDLQRFTLPSLVLQTLVENSVKHGLSQMTGVGEIRIEAHAVQDGLILSVNNTCERSIPSTSGFGLSNTKSRLDLLYGDQHEFNFSIDQGLAKASFRIPLRDKNA